MVFFIDGFKDESINVQLQLLTATVKVFLKRPGSAQELVQKVLQTATQGVDNPDLRDRAYVYWRILSSNPQVAKVMNHCFYMPGDYISRKLFVYLTTALIPFFNRRLF